MRFLLDANTFIQANRTYYRYKFCPAYWDWIDAECQKGNLISISLIREELEKGEDDLSAWAHSRPQLFEDINDEDTQNNFGVIAQHVMQLGGFISGAQQEFLDCADPWLIARALSMGDDVTVVTQETYDPLIKKKVKLPNICKDFSVSYIDTFELLEILKARFVLST